RFAGASWPKEQKIAYRASRWIQAGQEHLVYFHNFFDCLVLANDLPPQGGLKILRICAAPVWIKCSIKTGPHTYPRLIRPRAPRKKGMNAEMEAVALEL